MSAIEQPLDGREAAGLKNREAILQALADQVVEQGYFDFSVREIAERAGVSQRTVYNHFPNRQAMLQALHDWLDARWEAGGGASLPTDLASLPALMRTNAMLFAEHRELLLAMSKLDGQDAELEQAGRRQRTEGFRRVIAEGLPDLDEDGVHALTGVLRTLASGRAWHTMHEELAIPAHDTANALSWAMRVLIDAATEGDLPVTGEEEPS